MQEYQQYFRSITGYAPWPFQEEFGREVAPFTALIIPTGLGKTHTVLADWLYRRPTTRLLWILPGRALTAQVAEVAREMVEAASLQEKIRIVELMGGSEDLDLMLRPDEPAILIGTLDIAVSRALNRGYARSPFRWPMDFALLNNDIQLVFDEVQLQGEALATSTQLAAFREKFGCFGQTPCVWISATFDVARLRTVDFRAAVREVRLSGSDLEHNDVRRRLEAPKALQAAPEDCRTSKGIAAFVKREHRPGTLTLVIVNTVPRAREVYEELEASKPLLLHSRFRGHERAQVQQRLKSFRSGIIVSTQVVEAGIDLDADLMVTDPAPWAALTQRFGRVNRRGERDSSRIYWVDRPLKKDKKVRKPEEDFAPYEPDEVEEAIETLKGLDSAAPQVLPPAGGKVPYKNVLRLNDLLDLFDTTPDLTGNQIDVSRFVRSGEDTDVYFAWRDWEGKRPSKTSRLHDSELCPVPIADAGAFVEKREGWVWMYTQKGEWQKAQKNSIYPGARILFRGLEGGYRAEMGWQPDSKASVPQVPEPKEVSSEEEAGDDDPDSVSGYRSLADHTTDVLNELAGVLEALGHLGLDDVRDILTTAARYHDWGKVHRVFDETMHRRPGAPEGFLAKSPYRDKHRRAFFRHELASALAMAQSGHSDLAAYLVAAHHGKVRMNIRSMPEEDAPTGTRVARGIFEGDVLPDSLFGAEVRLSLNLSDLGQEDENAALSWTRRANSLLREWGPFKLAFLETLLRSADGAASARPVLQNEEVA